MRARWWIFYFVYIKDGEKWEGRVHHRLYHPPTPSQLRQCEEAAAKNLECDSIMLTGYHPIV